MAARAAASLLQRRLLCSAGKGRLTEEKATAKGMEKLEYLSRKEFEVMIQDLNEIKSNMKASNNADWSYWRVATPIALALGFGIYSNQFYVKDMSRSLVPPGQDSHQKDLPALSEDPLPEEPEGETSIHTCT